MAASTDMSNATQRVPAWKRIGLKLKYAKDTPEQTTPPATKSSPNEQFEQKDSNGKSLKRTANEDTKSDSPASKRFKPSIPEQNIVTRKYGFGASSQPISEISIKTPKKIVFDSEDQPSQATLERPTLRKSVSFTPDTKVEDGFSASNYFKAWVQEGQDSTETQDHPQQQQAEEEPTSPSKTESTKSKKSKKPKKSKSTQISSTKDNKTSSSKSPTSPTTPAYITYLTTFTTSKANWKFSKNHQNSLLKHLFDLDALPAIHNGAIVGYISGLQGSARARVAQEVREILQASEEGADGDERVARARAILNEALDGEAAAASTTATTPVTLPNKPLVDTKPARRKRKARTEVSSSSSSSSDSSSNSSSESDSDSSSDSDSE